MVETVKQYDLNDKENKVYGQQPPGYGRCPDTTKQEQDDDDQVDEKVDANGYKIAQNDNIR
jgi:hypothetical protein